MTEDAETSDVQLLPAKEVYVLMTEKCSVSRNSRTNWYMKHLNHALPYKHQEDVSKDEDFEILSCLPADDIDSQHSYYSNLSSLRLTTDTAVTFIAHRYRFVFILDLSPSLSALDATASGVVYEQIYPNLRNTLKALVKPFVTPGGSSLLRPEIFVTVVGITAAIKCQTKHVLLHGCLVTDQNVDTLLTSIGRELHYIESSVADSLDGTNPGFTDVEDNEVSFGVFDSYSEHADSEVKETSLTSHQVVATADAHFFVMLRYGILALQLLPENSISGIVVMTDSVVGLPDPSVMDLLLQQLHRDTVACSFVQLDRPHSTFPCFGLIPHPELLEFFAQSTGGTFFRAKPRLMETGDPAMNSVHRGLLSRQFHRTKSMDDVRDNLLVKSMLDQRLWPVKMLKKRHKEVMLQAPLNAVLACRLCEGFTIRNICLVNSKKGDQQLEVYLMLPWRDTVKIHYCLLSGWPLSTCRPVTQVQMITEASYSFFMDTCFISAMQQPSPKSGYRSAVVAGFLQTISTIVQTDQCLEKLLTFNTNPLYYTVPDGLRHGLALCVMPSSGIPTCQLPPLNHQLHLKDSAVMEFAQFWRRFYMLDAAYWQKWFNVYRIGVVLKHEENFNKHIHVSNADGAYNQFYCRQSLELLFSLLHRSTSFVLVDRHTYVTLLFSDLEKLDSAPTSFYVIRVDSKLPCVVLRVVFLCGTPSIQRKKILAQLKADIASLRFPQRTIAQKPTQLNLHGTRKQPVAAATSAARPNVELNNVQRRPSADRVWSDRPCCLVMRKPIEKVLVRYERIPSDFTKGSSIIAFDCIESAKSTSSSNEPSKSAIFSEYSKSISSNSDHTKSADSEQTLEQQKSYGMSSEYSHSDVTNQAFASAVASLSRFFHHRRWIWSLVCEQSTAVLSGQAVGRIVSHIVQVRLHEGFNLIHTHEGVLYLAIELDLQCKSEDTVSVSVQPCIVHYVIFPPNNLTYRDSFSEDESSTVDDMDSVNDESVSEPELITECWIEPVHGTVINCPTPLDRLNGLSYTQLPDVFFSIDAEVISAVLTFERLCALCQSPSSILNMPGTSLRDNDASASGASFVPLVSASSPFTSKTLTDTTPISNSRVDQVTFACDVVQLLQHCQFVRLLFSSLRHCPARGGCLDNGATNDILLSLMRDQLRPVHNIEMQLSDNSSTELLQLLCERKGGKTDRELPATRWHCFVRCASSAHLIVSVLPAAYSDLMTLKTTLTEFVKQSSEASNDDKSTSVDVEANHKLSVSNDDSHTVREHDKTASADSDVTVADRNVTNTADLELVHHENTSKEEDGVATASHEATASAVKSVSLIKRAMASPLPVFVFDCLLSSVSEQLFNTTMRQRPDDLEDNLTFQSFDDNKQSSQAAQSAAVTQSGSLPGRSRLGASSGEERRKTSECEGGSRGPKRISTHDVYGDREVLRQHCGQLSDIYLRCFVTGVYRSLLSGGWVDSRDIDEAVNNICEELSPIEIDITQYIQSSCRLLHPTLDIAILRQTLLPSDEVARSPSTATSLGDEEHLDDGGKSDRSKQNCTVPVSSLLNAHNCELSTGLHQLVHSKFMNILGQSFKPVPSNDEYFYFYGTSVRRPTASSNITFEDDAALQSTSTTEPRDLHVYDGKLYYPEYAGGSFGFVRGSASSSGSSDTTAASSDRNSLTPLFVHLVCSVRLPSSSLRSVPVRSLPMCLGELRECLLDHSSADLDISNLRVTLDIICLTLPSLDDISSQRSLAARPSFSRLTSFVSQTSFSAEQEMDAMTPTKTILSVGELFSNGPLRHLSTIQQFALQGCQNQITWLLKDEIVSSMRCSLPINVDTLSLVCSHIKSSPGQVSACMSREVPLQFVYLPERSREYFVQDFEKMRVAGRYKLLKCGEYYFLSRDRHNFIPDEHAVALSSALRKLSISSPSPAAVKTEGPFTQNISSTAELTKKTSTADNQDSKSPTSVHNVSTAVTSVSVSTAAADGVKTVAADEDKEEAVFPRQLENGELACDKIVMPVVSLPLISGPTPHDIRIMVQRPSPIREVPSSLLGLKPSSETTVMEDAEQGLPENLQLIESQQLQQQAQATQQSEEPVNSGQQAADQTTDKSAEQETLSDASKCDATQPESSPTSTELQQPQETETEPRPTGSNDERLTSPLPPKISTSPSTHQTKETDSRRVRPISGPAAAVYVGQLEFDFVRKSRSVTGSLDEEAPPSTPFALRSCPVKRDGVFQRPAESSGSGQRCPIRRIHSTVSFDRQSAEKLKSGSSSMDRESSTPISAEPVHSAQVQSAGGPFRSVFYGLRSRHASGFDTPMSFIETSSVASTGEAVVGGFSCKLLSSTQHQDDIKNPTMTLGYEGDSSDADDDAVSVSASDSLSCPVKLTPLIDFWLIFQLEIDKVYVFFQTRDPGTATNQLFRQHKEIYQQIIDTINKICHRINQKLLLDDLYETKHCNILLVPKADEDLRWVQDKPQPTGGLHRRRAATAESESSDSDAEGQPKYLAAALHLMPGHFACDCVWQTHFVLHPRLKSSCPKTGSSTVSPGVQALLSVLEKFRVENRRNLFVVRDNKTNAIFYIRLSEMCQEIKAQVVSSSENEDTIIQLSASQNPSKMSVALRRISRNEDTKAVSSGLTTAAGNVGSDRDGETSPASAANQARRGSLSGGASGKSRTEERITLSVHGIYRDVGTEITQNLIHMLQKRLDDAVLNEINVTLTRNPMYKLAPEDVQFIQKPSSDPEFCLQLLVPSAAVLHQSALGFYLRQNLLQFLFVPKYQDTTHVENMFQDFMANGSCADSDAFLYRPTLAGTKGIACIFLSFIDGKGCPVQLLPSPKPSKNAYTEPIDRSMFDSLLHIVQYKQIPSSCNKSPGPTSMIQFRVWQCGNVDLETLSESLTGSVRHAVCDVILEYRLLTAPICQVPPHYCKGMPSPMHSAPTSPNNGLSTPADSRHLPLTSTQSAIMRPTPEYMSRSAIKTPKEASSSMQTMFLDMFKPKVVDGTSVTPQSKDANTESEQNANDAVPSDLRQEQAVLVEKIRQYENGEKGKLNPIFPSTVRHWLDHCNSIGVPAVIKHQFALLSRFPVDCILREMVSMLGNLTPDNTVAVFRSQDPASTTNGDSLYIQYKPQRQISGMSKETRSLSEVSLDFSKTSAGTLPGRAYSYVLIGRNVDQWRNSLDSAEQELLTSSLVKGMQKSQKFAPLEAMLTGSSGISSMTHGSSATLVPSSSTASFNVDFSDKSFIPRQKLLMLTVDDKKVTLHMYNWTNELAGQVERQLMRQIQWHNARSHLVTCLALQKMGLFRHLYFTDLAVDANSQELNIFVQPPADIESLVKIQIPSSTQIMQKVRSRSGSIVSTRLQSNTQPLIPLSSTPFLDDLFRDKKPPIPMYRASNYAYLRDPVHRHGAQALELRALERKEAEKKEKLEKVYIAWQQRLKSTQHHITEDTLELLKKSSRLIHCVSTPFLFNPAWRHQAMCRPDQLKKDASSDTNKQRSRHSSGASVRSKRSDSVDSAAPPTKVSSTASLQELLTRQLRCEDQWHSDLRDVFVQIYIKYLQQPGAGFQQIQIVPPISDQHLNRSMSSDRMTPRQSATSLGSSGNSPRTSAVGTTRHYLQKTLPGGIILIELSFQEVFFCASVYAYEGKTMSDGKKINAHLAMLFTDESDKVRDIMHVHSYAYDFSLREVQSFLASSGSGVRLPPEYHLTAFLHDFVGYFMSEPIFARNCIREELLSIPCGGISGQQLFEYMRNNDKKYGMRTVYMCPNPLIDATLPDSQEREQFALVFHPTRVTQNISVGDSSSEFLGNNYEVGLVVTTNTRVAAAGSEQKSSASDATDLQSSQLQLRFWVLLTNEREIFPRLTLENKHRMPHVNSQARSLAAVLRDSSRFSIEPVGPQFPRVRKISASTSQSLMYDVLLKETHFAKNRIVEMVNGLKTLCLRDILWNRLMWSDVAEEPGTRRRRRTGEDDFHDPLAAKLTYTEFCELLDHVTKVDICEFDPNLRQLVNVPAILFQSLVRILVSRYPDTHRLFVGPEMSGNSVQYVAVVSARIDVFPLLHVDVAANKFNMYLVFHDGDLVPKMNSELVRTPNIEIRHHIESFVSSCLYHMWTSLIV